MSVKIKLRSGTLAELNSIYLDNAEVGFTTDTKELFVGSGGINYPISRQYGLLVPIDYSIKSSFANIFKKTSGVGTLSYSTYSGIIGTGSFKISGNGTWVVDRLTAISPLTGIGGQVSIKGLASFNIGCTFYDETQTLISTSSSQQNFLANGITGTGSFAQYTNWLRFEGSGANNIPTNAKYAKPFITVSSNSGSVYFDDFVINFLSMYANYGFFG